MKKRALLIVVATVVFFLLAAGIWYFLISKKSSSSKGLENQSIGSINLSLKDLIIRGTSQVCSFSDNETSGIIYINGERFREEVEIQGDGDNKPTKVYVIVMDNTFYTWDEGAKEGVSKSFDIKSVTEPDTETEGVEQSDGPDLETPMNYNCKSWAYEKDKFELPKDVNFKFIETSASDQVETEIETTTQCSYCYKLAGDDKTQCLSALKCN